MLVEIYIILSYVIVTFYFYSQNLTGGPNGGIHATDVTNASRTMLMNLDTLNWDEHLLMYLIIILFAALIKKN